MADRYLRFAGSAPDRFLTRCPGLPRPVVPHRWSTERPLLDGSLLHVTIAESAGGRELAGVLARTGLPVRTGPAQAGTPSAAVVVDASSVTDVGALREVHGALHPVVRSLADCGRVVLIGSRPDPLDHGQAAVQQGR
jgi:3-oxoacyl-[acyl-carrier protein] reductase